LTNAAYSAHPALAVTAEVVLPTLGAMTLLLPWLARREGRLSNPGLLWACGLASIALLYIVREVNLKTGFSIGEWKLHFSSHTALAISFAITLVAYRFFMLPIVATIVVGYVWLMTCLHYHVPGDALITAAVILPLSILCHLPWWRKKAMANGG
jgi:hypothetical protein